jgi:hypothetical protein
LRGYAELASEPAPPGPRREISKALGDLRAPVRDQLTLKTRRARARTAAGDTFNRSAALFVCEPFGSQIIHARAPARSAEGCARLVTAQLRDTGETNGTVQSLLTEALNDPCTKHHRPPIA